MLDVGCSFGRFPPAGLHTYLYAESTRPNLEERAAIRRRTHFARKSAMNAKHKRLRPLRVPSLQRLRRSGALEKQSRASGAAHATGLGLTPREQEVLALLAQGLLYKEIADRLNVSYATVHKLQHKIFIKLHVSNRTEAAIKWTMLSGN